MLSAVAARKARLAGQSIPTTATLQPKPLPTPPHPLIAPESEKPPKILSKRKTSESTQKPPKKKPKKPQSKRKAAAEKHPRYFVEDVFEKQQDVVVIPDDSTDASDTSHDDMSVDGDGYDLEHFAAGNRVPMQPSADPAARRAWSPSAPPRDSSDEEQDNSSQPTLSPQLPPEPAVLSTFQPIFGQNAFRFTSEEAAVYGAQIQQKGVLLVLSPGDIFTMLGTLCLTMLSGSISLYGARLSASPTVHRVFAPRSAPLPVAECLSSDEIVPGNLSLLPEEVRRVNAAGTVLVLIQELLCGVEGLGSICRTFDGVFVPSPWHTTSATVDLGLHNVHLVVRRTRDLFPVQIPQAWEVEMSDMMTCHANGADVSHSRLICLVKGPRNSGKSTFARTLLNRLLSKYKRVAFMECDLGQSEFTPGGMVALNILDQPVFGPPFTHPSIPYAAHFVGAVSPRSSPSHYLESIQALLQTYELDIRHATVAVEHDVGETDGRIADIIPLIVNTMGWTKGLGGELSHKIEELVEPSDVFGFASPNPDDQWTFDTTLSQHLNLPPHGLKNRHLTSVASCAVPNHYTAADHRAVSILSYLHAIFPSDPPISPLQSIVATAWNTAIPLCAQDPYEVDCQVAFDRIIVAGAGMEDVVPTEVHRVLNGAIVALVRCEDVMMNNELDDVSPPTTPLRYQQATSPPPPSTSNCSGLALIRSLSCSPALVCMHVLTPCPTYTLGSARVLIKGELELPIWGMLDFRNGEMDNVTGVERARVPFLKWGKGEGAGGERRRVRRNLMRKGQM